AVQDQIRQWVPGDFYTLGADGFGFADTRAAPRRFFKIDGPSMVVRALQGLADQGKVDRSTIAQASSKYDLHNVNAGSSGSAGGESGVACDRIVSRIDGQGGNARLAAPDLGRSRDGDHPAR